MEGVLEGLRWLVGGLLALFAMLSALTNVVGMLTRFIQKRRTSGLPFGMVLIVGSLALVVLPVSLPAGVVWGIVIGLLVADCCGRLWPASLVDPPKRDGVPTDNGPQSAGEVS